MKFARCQRRATYPLLIVIQSIPKVALAPIPIFYNPHYDTVASCLPTCRSPANPPKYEPKALGDYLVSKFDKAYAYRRAMKAEPA